MFKQCFPDSCQNLHGLQKYTSFEVEIHMESLLDILWAYVRQLSVPAAN